MKLQHPAIKELYNILKERDWTEFCPEKSRAGLLDVWLDKWLMEAEVSQSVLNFKYLSSEYTDAIKYKLGQELAEIVAEECSTYKIDNTRVSSTLLALRRKAEKK